MTQYRNGDRGHIMYAKACVPMFEEYGRLVVR